MDLQLSIQNLIEEHGYGKVLSEIALSASCNQKVFEDAGILSADDRRSFQTVRSGIATIAYTAADQVDDFIREIA